MERIDPEELLKEMCFQLKIYKLASVAVTTIFSYRIPSPASSLKFKFRSHESSFVSLIIILHMDHYSLLIEIIKNIP